MEKKMFISLFLERTVKALNSNIKSIELRLSEAGEEYVMISYKDMPLIVPVTNMSNTETSIAILTAIKGMEA